MTHSVSDLRKILVDSGKYTQEQADNIKGKSKLSELVLGLNDEEGQITKMFEEAEVESEVTDLDVKQVEKVPSKLSPAWQEYVLKQFEPNELEDGKYPLLVGLRRVAEKLLGTIVSSYPREVKTSVDDRNPTGYTTCVYEVQFQDRFDDTLVYRFGGAASAHRNNTDDEYSVFPEAIAEARAEARTLRKALNLRVVSKDEITSKNIKDVISNLESKESERNGQWDEDAEISTSQKMVIDKTASRLGIDISKLLVQESLNPDINEISKKDAAKVIDLLNKYQSSSKESIVIPVEIKR